MEGGQTARWVTSVGVLETRETRVAWIDLCEDGLVRLFHRPGVYVAPDDIDEVTAVFRDIAGRAGQLYVLLNSPGAQGVSPAARARAASPECAAVRAAMAILATSAVQRIAANLFIRFNRPPHPVRMFAAEDDAAAWLHGLMAAGGRGGAR